VSGSCNVTSIEEAQILQQQGQGLAQDEQAAGQQSRQAGLIQQRDWLFYSELIALCHCRSKRDPKRTSDCTRVPMRMASVE